MCLNRIVRSLVTAAILCLAALTALPAMAEGDGRLTTHVLDTMIGKPGVGMRTACCTDVRDGVRGGLLRCSGSRLHAA